MKKFFVLLGLLLFFVTPVFSATWVKVDDKLYIDKDSISSYIDDKNITHKEQKIYWRKNFNDESEVFKDAEKRYNKKIGYLMLQGIINLSNKTSCSKTIIFYDLKGNLIDSYTFSDNLLNWNRIVPDTYGEFFSKIVSDKTSLEKIYEAQLEKEK